MTCSLRRLARLGLLSGRTVSLLLSCWTGIISWGRGMASGSSSWITNSARWLKTGQTFWRTLMNSIIRILKRWGVKSLYSHESLICCLPVRREPAAVAAAHPAAVLAGHQVPGRDGAVRGDLLVQEPLLLPLPGGPGRPAELRQWVDCQCKMSPLLQVFQAPSRSWCGPPVSSSGVGRREVLTGRSLLWLIIIPREICLTNII